jgi:hypothetical protein
MVWRWWWPSGAITLAVLASNDGGVMTGGEAAGVASTLGRRGEAAERCGTPASGWWPVAAWCWEEEGGGRRGRWGGLGLLG